MSQHDVFLLNQSEALSNKEIDAIQRKGFSISITNQISEVAQKIGALYQPIILINAVNKDLQLSFTEEVCGNKILQSYPLIFLAEDINGLEGQLNRAFPLAIVIQKPSESSKIIEALRFVSRNYRGARTKEEEQVEAQLGSEYEEESVERVNANILSANNLFSAVRECNLSQIDLGGSELPLLLSDHDKNASCTPTLPEKVEFKAACNNFLSKLRKPLQEALERVNIITLKIIAPLNLTPEIVEITQTASILYAQAFAKQHRALLTQEYSFRGAIVLRKEICSAIKDSALNIGGELSNRELSRVIASVGKIIGEEDNGGEDPISVAASAIVAADLINRNCYQAFFWNASAAYGLLRKIRQGRIKGLHPAVICILLKLLAEALSSPIHKKLMASTRSEEETEALEKSLHINEEKVVELPELIAGMRLSRPLETEDGKAILAEDLVLDDDLIMRIWQLSSIRLINKAVVKRAH